MPISKVFVWGIFIGVLVALSISGVVCYFYYSSSLQELEVENQMLGKEIEALNYLVLAQESVSWGLTYETTGILAENYSECISYLEKARDFQYNADFLLHKYIELGSDEILLNQSLIYLETVENVSDDYPNQICQRHFQK